MHPRAREPSAVRTATPQRFLTVSSWMATGALLSVVLASTVWAVGLVYLAQAATNRDRPAWHASETTRLLGSVLTGSGHVYSCSWRNGRDGTVTAVARDVLVGGAASADSCPAGPVSSAAVKASTASAAKRRIRRPTRMSNRRPRAIRTCLCCGQSAPA